MCIQAPIITTWYIETRNEKQQQNITILKDYGENCKLKSKIVKSFPGHYITLVCERVFICLRDKQVNMRC